MLRGIGRNWMVPKSTVMTVGTIFKSRHLKMAAARKIQIAL